MRENETSNKAKFTVFLSNSGRVVFGVTSSIILLVGWFIMWKTKTRFYLNSFLFDLGILVVLGCIFGVAKVIDVSEFDLMDYRERKERGLDPYNKPKNILTIILMWGWILSIIVVLIGAIISSEFVKSRSYYTKVEDMVTVISDSEETSAFPNLLGENNDTSNIPLIGIPEAIKKAETEMGRFSALGSQFELRTEDMTSQSINGQLCYVIPLQPKSWLKWSDDGNQGYFIIDRNNGNTTFVEDSLVTTTEAPFGDSTQRIINNYLNDIGVSGYVTDISPEVDDEGNFHYIGTVYSIQGIGGYKTVKGVVEVDAWAKTCNYYSMDEIPEYVDRVYPESFFNDYLTYYGSYKKGFWNSILGQKGVQEQTKGSDVIYIDGVCYYYTGWTPTGKGESSNGIMMMNSRTGEIAYYTTYGISEEKAQGIAEGLVQEKEYTASYPLLLQVGGKETYFMLMRDKKENLVGYAFVSYKDYTKAAVSTSLLEAQANYVKALASGSNSKALDETSIAKKSGTISNITSEVLEGTTIYYVKIEGSDTIYQLFSNLDINIVFATIGDSIEIEYYDSGSNLETATSCKVKPQAVTQ